MNVETHLNKEYSFANNFVNTNTRLFCKLY